MPLSKRNRRGLIVLVTIATLLSFAPRVLSSFRTPSKLDVHEAELAEMELEKRKEIKQNRNAQNKHQKFRKPPSKFDPNSYTRDQWIYLGLSEKQAEVVLKFASSGFNSTEDLQRIYFFSDEFIGVIKDSLMFPERVLPHPTKGRSSNFNVLVDKVPLLIDLNIASSEDLQKIKGIGPYFGDKIVEYREQLGGFVNKEQLLEIWKFDADKYASVSSNVFISGDHVSRINLNQADYNELISHPYINKNIANALIKYRDQHGFYTSIEEIKKVKIVDVELFKKLKPYLIL